MKRIYVLLGTLAMLGILSACGDKTAASSSAGATEISVAWFGIQDSFDRPNAKNDVFYKQLCEKFNITFKPVQITWNDWKEKAKVWAASDQLPDIFVSDSPLGEYFTWANQGVIKALPADLSKFPNIKKIMDQPSVKPLAVDGKFYKFPRQSYETADDWANSRNIIYRKDWAAQAGYSSAPKNFEEFLSMCKAVMVQHPGITGVSTTHNGFLLTIMLGVFPAGTHDAVWYKENGQWKPGWTTEGFTQGVTQLRTLYAQGILDQDLPLLKDNDGNNKFYSGQAFAYFGDGVRYDRNQWTAGNPNAPAETAIAYIDIWPASDGNKYYFIETPYWSELMFSARVSDEKMDTILTVLDYMSNDEYMAQRACGELNVDYKIEGGAYISLLPLDTTLEDKYPITANVGALPTWMGPEMQSNDPIAAFYADYNKTNLVEKKATRKPMPVNFDIRLMDTPAKNRASAFNSEMLSELVQVIVAKDDPAVMWKNVITGFEGRGLKEAINEVNVRAQQMGL
ncbi:hypothetical protein FACS1894163_11080 [Spirochaetia bacterium]|nr:hypothetical protein FACS1894163_11080 [Spirochaetia bacterium]